LATGGHQAAGGQLSVAIQATLLDEANLEFVTEDLGHEHVDTLDQALAVIRSNGGARMEHL
jgi:hypothetical protein